MTGKKIVLLIVLFVLDIAGSCTANELVFQDDFDTYSVRNWGTLPKYVTTADGALVSRPEEGQNRLVSLKKFGLGKLQIRLRFKNLDPTTTYSIGLQETLPWGNDICWLIVNNKDITLQLRKERGTVLNQNIGTFEPNKWYVVEFDRSEKAVSVSLDDKVVCQDTVFGN